uniref:Reverse transcriptase domain-containing protein n=1 Tax=Latimeria chalumnae TaxID=7897 RepID=H3AE19_LATCH
MTAKILFQRKQFKIALLRKANVTDLVFPLTRVKPGTAAGYDNILPELLKHLGNRALKWLAQFFTRVAREGKLPRFWRISKVIALPKPGKDPHSTANYRQISLLSVCLKVLERLILQLIYPDVENIL